MPSSSVSAPAGNRSRRTWPTPVCEVVGIEADLVGGECPYWGCIPSKAMVRAAELLAEGRRIPGRAGTADVTPDWAPVARRVREVTGSWDDRAAVERLESKGGRFVRGRARLNAPSSVDVGGTTITARRALVLATGQRAWVPPMFEPVPHWTNRELIESESVPASLLVIGGGSVGLELGQVMQRFGAAVSIVEAGPRLAASEEPEASELITDVLRGDGVDVHTGVAIERVEPYGPTGAQVELAGGNVLRGERMLVATGRRSDLRALGVGALGLDEDARSLPVDGRMRVAPGVWAVGDVTGKGAFTHVAVYQARLCVADILGRPRPDADYRALPRVTFTDPEVGSVGLTEEQAPARGRRRRRVAGLGRRLGPGLAPRRRRFRQARGPRRRGRRRDRDVPLRRRGVQHVGARRARRAHPRDPADDDLRLPDVPPRGGLGVVVSQQRGEDRRGLMREQ